MTTNNDKEKTPSEEMFLNFVSTTTTLLDYADLLDLDREWQVTGQMLLEFIQESVKLYNTNPKLSRRIVYNAYKEISDASGKTKAEFDIVKEKLSDNINNFIPNIPDEVLDAARKSINTYKESKERMKNEGIILKNDKVILGDIRTIINKEISEMPEDLSDEMKEDIQAYAEFEMMCASDCSCEESCEKDMATAVIESDEVYNKLTEAFENTKMSDVLKSKQQNGRAAIENGNGVFSKPIKRSKPLLPVFVSEINDKN